MRTSRILRANPGDLLQRLPGPRTPRWPEGERFVEAFRHGSLVVGWRASAAIRRAARP
jgi:hypothetical protein